MVMSFRNIPALLWSWNETEGRKESKNGWRLRGNYPPQYITLNYEVTRMLGEEGGGSSSGHDVEAWHTRRQASECTAYTFYRVYEPRIIPLLRMSSSQVRINSLVLPSLRYALLNYKIRGTRYGKE